MKLKYLALTLALGGALMTNPAAAADINDMSMMKNAVISQLDDDTRVYRKIGKYQILKARFANRYGFEVAAHLYLPENFSKDGKYKAVVISGPFGAVKEQVSGLYAQEFARKGFVALAFDPSTTGQSSGARRDMASPDIFTEDYSAAVDFVTNLTFVAPDAVGAMGICGLSGMAITAAINDVRIRAVAVSAMYDMSDSIRNHYNGAYYTPAQRLAVKEHLAAMRDKEAKTGQVLRDAHEVAVNDQGKTQSFDTMFPDSLPADADPVVKDFFGYYVTRAYHPRAVNSNTSAWDSLTPYGFFNFSLMEHIDELVPRPLLLVTGDKAHSRYFSENVYQKASEPKEMIVVPGATHVDLYDQMDKIPFDRIIGFFEKNLEKNLN